MQAKTLPSISFVLFVILVPSLDLMLAFGEIGALLSLDCGAIDQTYNGGGVCEKSADGNHFGRLDMVTDIEEKSRESVTEEW